MWLGKRQRVPRAQLRAEATIASTLDGADALPAWNAVWDLIQAGDQETKVQMLAELRNYVNASAGDSSTALVMEFEAAIDETMRRVGPAISPSAEVRAQDKQAQIETHRAAMRAAGIRPGEGIPMWAMYMTRRSKRTWS